MSAAGVVVVGLARVMVVVMVVMPVAAGARRNRGPREGGAGGRLKGVSRGDGGSPG